jgi:hypothetical protein
VVAHLSQLLDHVHHRYKISALDLHVALPRNEFIIEVLLPSRELTFNDHLLLLGELFLDVPLQPTQHERSKDRMQFVQETSMDLPVMQSLLDWTTEPIQELLVVVEHDRHQKVEETPHLAKIILERSTCQK